MLKDIVDLTVIQIRVFAVDIVPLNIITTQSCVQKIRESLSINLVEPPPFIEGITPIIFQRGEIRTDGNIIVINRIEIEPRRIIIEIIGTSKQANQVYELLLSSISLAANIEVNGLRQPLLTAENTRCVVTLDFHLNALFSDSFVGFLNGELKNKASTQLATATIEPLGISTQVTYQIKDEILLNNKIGMNPKQFTIAPRPGIPLDARRYITSSPFDSDTHLRLIRTLNKVMAKTAKE